MAENPALPHSSVALSKRAITNWDEARYILLNEDYISGPVDEDFRYWREFSGVELTETQSFFSAWPMLTNGKPHKEVRHTVLAALHSLEHINVEQCFVGLINGCKRGFVDEKIVADVATRFYEQLFGMSEAQQVSFRKQCRLLVEFQLDGGKPENLLLLDREVRALRSWFASEEFSTKGLICQLRTNNANIDLQIALAMDAYEPVRSALGFALINAASKIARRDNVSSEMIVSEALLEYPPFRYINRKDKFAAYGAPKVSIQVELCNADGNREGRKHGRSKGFNSLTFGMGAHSCPGARLSLDFVKAAVEVFLRSTSDMRLVTCTYEMTRCAGMNGFTSLTIKMDPQR